ncbi:DegT/DnrJ/EryC1/StrS family aminotransferase [Streptomyces sp. NPDC005784]|uniref:DegT/DnrJ/EryC1/StrS family aminotransferase n=1 Tax=Streptomyces sp. NPDC005784 TaxID=3364731 RepID=UPI0036831DBD
MQTTTLPAGVGQNASPFLHGGEAAAIAAVLAAGQYGHGPLTERFEQSIAHYLGVEDVVAVSSGTTALVIGLQAAGIGPGDEVIVPSLTFCASVQAIVAVGAVPRFIDVDPATLCVTSDGVLGALSPDTRAVMPVLYGGRAVGLDSIRDVLDARGILLIEDAAHAFGSRTKGRMVGSTGALTCFSFDPIKNLTTGQGGAIVPRSPEEARRARSLRLFGLAQSREERASITSYAVEGPGLRSELSQINAAFGLVQLKHFSTVAAKRTHLWRTYREALSELDAALLVDVDVDRSVPFNCVVRISADQRDTVFEVMRGQGIGVGVHYPPNHSQPAFATWHRPLAVTDEIGRQILSLPFHPALSDEAAHFAVAALSRALRATS